MPDIKVLPSQIILPDENTIAWENLSDNRREVYKKQICTTIGQQLSCYYTAQPEEWKEFVQKAGIRA